MPEKKVKPYSIGETFPAHGANGAIGVATLIEIVVLPDDPEEREINTKNFGSFKH